MGEKLTEDNEKMNRISEELTDVRTEQTLLKKLSAAGAVDLDAALVLAKARIGEGGDGDVDGVVEQLPFFQIAHQLSEVLIDVLDHAIKTGRTTLEPKIGEPLGVAGRRDERPMRRVGRDIGKERRVD